MSSGKEFDQIVGCEFLSGASSADMPDIPEQCRGCDVLGSFVAEIERMQTVKETNIRLGAHIIEGFAEDPQKPDEEESCEQEDKDLAQFMMRMQDAGIESANVAIEGWKQDMQATIAQCNTGLTKLEKEVGGTTYIAYVCTSATQSRGPSSEKS